MPSQTNHQEHEQTVVLLDDSLRAAGGFTQIPNAVLRHPTLSMGSKVAYSVLLSYAWQDHFCHPAQESLAVDCGISDRQVRRLLNELKVIGAISWKQLGLNRPNRYYIHPITNWIKPKPLPKSPDDQDRTYLSGPEWTPASGLGRTSPSALGRTPASDYKDSEKNTHNTHTEPTASTKGEGVCSSPSKTKELALLLINRFHAEHGRAVEDRRPSRKELAFACDLVDQHGFEKANHVITYGRNAAAETNYNALHFQGYEQYVADALADFKKRERRKAREEEQQRKKQAEHAERVREMEAYYARPLDDRVEESLERWVDITRKLKKREPTAEEIAERREFYRGVEIKNGEQFAQQLQKAG